MDWTRRATVDTLVAAAVAGGTIAVVLLGSGNRSVEPTDTTAPAPVAVDAAVSAGRRTAVPEPEVAGWVRNTAGDPGAGITITFTGEPSGTVTTVDTTPDGAYALALVPGRYRIACAVPRTTCTTVLGATSVEVSGPSEVDLVVHPTDPRG